ncbi:MAG: CoA activase [Syntrophobacteraceae bacterium]|jgi:predicted nucleotide-binding protein (sugar kinase/HSP70/actin superfamily)
MTVSGKQHFGRFYEKVKQFDVTGKTLLIPAMAPFSSPLLAASFRAVGVNALIMETYKGLALGKEFTSGKECFPCQVTLGDILYYLRGEKERLGAAFSPDNYVYFLPEADGPCRFGMYNKMQRLVLDRFEEFRDIPITYVSTRDSYSAADIMPAEASAIFRKLTFATIIVSDIFDRIVWRVRPYELRPGLTDSFMEKALEAAVAEVEQNGASLEFKRLFNIVEDVASTAKTFIDTRQPQRPLIGIIGEIYVRTHQESNQHIARVLERFGAEVVVASVAEWINYITYDVAREHMRHMKLALQKLDFASLRGILNKWISTQIEKYYQLARQRQVYRRALKYLDIRKDHRIAVLEKRLDRDRLYSFDIGTESALSIGAALEQLHEGYNGVVNVFPFTCMPSAVCTAVLKPLLNKMRMPYIDAPYDGAIQPNREIALRTFVYQAKQHLESRTSGQRNGKAA